MNVKFENDLFVVPRRPGASFTPTCIRAYGIDADPFGQVVIPIESRTNPFSLFPFIWSELERNEKHL